MNDDIDLQALWQGKAVVTPSLADTIGKARQYKQQMRNKILLGVVVLVLTVVFILLVLFYSNLHMVTTKIGVALIIAAIVLISTYSLVLFLLLREPEVTGSNQVYLEQLLRFKKKQRFMQERLMTWYFILLAEGLALYMIEPTMKMQPTGKIIAYVLTFAWIGFNWWYVRPRTIRKQSAKINAIINAFEDFQRDLQQPVSSFHNTD